MINELQKESNYFVECDFELNDVIQSFQLLNFKYINEWCTYSSIKHEDYFIGCKILTHTFTILISSTMNLELSTKITTIAFLYYIEFISQINFNNHKNESTILLEIINQMNNETIPLNNKKIHDISKNDISHNFQNITMNLNKTEIDTTSNYHKNSITYHDVMLFVYNKTLSNIVKHYVKSSRKLEQIMCKCQYYFKLNTLMMQFFIQKEELLKNTVIIQKTYKKIMDMFNKYLQYNLTTTQLQCLVIFSEYIIIYSNYGNKQFITTISIFPSMLRKFNPNMTPNNALQHAVSHDFKYRIISSSPFYLVKWFICSPL